MLIVIDIPKEIYKASQILDVKYEDTVQIPFEVIANGMPLDKISAEIEKHRRKTKSIDSYDLVGDCLDIIDKYNSESEDTE